MLHNVKYDCFNSGISLKLYNGDKYYIFYTHIKDVSVMRDSLHIETEFNKYKFHNIANMDEVYAALIEAIDRFYDNRSTDG